jgi:glycerate 2-kinase
VGKSRAVADVRSALEATLRAADAEAIIHRRLKVRGDVLFVGGRKYKLGGFGRILVLGAGKASARMALGVERTMAAVTGGAVIAPEGQPKPPCKTIAVLDAPHPLTGRKSEVATRALLSVVGRPRADDFVVCLFSGGGSALMELPDSGVPLGDLRETSELLMKSGADIHELNTVRKHLSKVKGGRLAGLLSPATILTLVMSDVVGNQPDFIASGPTAPDSTTYRDAKSVLESRGVWNMVPGSVKEAIDEGTRGVRPETPKEGAPCFSKAALVQVGDNALCRRAAAGELRKRGYRTSIVPGNVTGEARVEGKAFVARLARLTGNGRHPAALVGGGETTVTVVGKGKGGRNQELVLASALVIGSGMPLWVASMGTDGVDGTTDAAGAVAGWKTVRKAKQAGVDPSKYLSDNDSYRFFRKVGGLIMTGPTGTNLNDVMIGVSGGARGKDSNIL